MAVQSNTRNFSIIAHIDHGKSTLADRLLQFTGAIPEHKMTEQVLDQMEVEREHGVTIKASAVRLEYHAKDGKNYILNLIDTPGHVDFAYEVSRTLAACEGTLLVVDAAQGVEAQTIANANLAIEHNLEIIPVINKIDLPSANPEKTKREIEEMIGIDTTEAILASAKEGIGTEEILEAIVRKIPPPKGNPDSTLRALIFDAHFDKYRGVVCYVRVFDGLIKPGMRIMMMSNRAKFEVSEVGVFKPETSRQEELRAGEVGYVIAGIKNLKEARVGDTITDAQEPAVEPLAGFQPAKPMVFCGLYPTNSQEYNLLRDAIEKLQLNDASISYEPETSAALGFGFRCGFLGLFHMQIAQERLEREFGSDVVISAPNVVYQVTRTDGKVVQIESPSKLPRRDLISKIEEPYVKATIIVPIEYLSACFELAEARRGTVKNIEYPTTNRVVAEFEFPMSEILLDFFDQLKSRTRGYASLDYEFIGYRQSDLVKVDILINGKPVDALSFITHRDKAYLRAKNLVERLKEVIPRQLFEVRIQGAIGSKVIASESIKPLRKDVLAKCYGGDVTRKRKLLEKQKEGKKRMKQIGQVEIPQEAFLSVLKVGD